MLSELGATSATRAILASTTSSLSVEQLAAASGRPDRFVGLHVFNPVTRMKLVELIYPTTASRGHAQARRWRSASVREDPVVVPDIPGFVVNRLLFPYLFSAVRLQEETGMEAEDIDTCMRLGAGHPMGPLALLDLVGLDVSAAIGQHDRRADPARVDELIADGALGRKSGRGFHSY